MCQETRSRQPTRNRPARCRRLHDPFAVSAAQLRAHMTNHPKTFRYVLQHLRYIFPGFPATFRHSGEKPSLSVRAFAFGVADAPAVDAAPVSLSQPAKKILQDHSRCAGFARRLAQLANLPTAVPVVRCAVAASLTCVRTASAGAG